MLLRERNKEDHICACEELDQAPARPSQQEQSQPPQLTWSILMSLPRCAYTTRTILYMLLDGI